MQEPSRHASTYTPARPWPEYEPANVRRQPPRDVLAEALCYGFVTFVVLAFIALGLVFVNLIA